MCLAEGQKPREETPDTDGADTEHVKPVLCIVVLCCPLSHQTILPFCLAYPLLGAPSHSSLLELAHASCAQGQGCALGHGAIPMGPQLSCCIGSRSVHAHGDRQMITATGQRGGKAGDRSQGEHLRVLCSSASVKGML